jgi:hypothetical protein
VELGEQIRHPLQLGALRVFALFLPRPRSVLEVEAVVERDLAAQGGDVRALTRVGISEGVQASALLEVTP